MNVFDTNMKVLHKNQTAVLPDAHSFDYLQDEIARRLVDRISDISRKFPVTADLGCNSCNIAKVIGDRGGVKKLININPARAQMMRDWQQRNGVWALNSKFREEPYEPIPSDVQVEFVSPENLERCPLETESADMIVSSLSLHWVNDLPGLLTSAREALKPDGVFLGAIFGGDTLQELRSSFALADMERLGGVAPHISPFAGPQDVGSVLQSAGFSMPTIDWDVITIPYPDMFTLADHLHRMGEQQCNLSRSFVSRDQLLAASAIYQNMYRHDDTTLPFDNPISATFHVIYMIGWSPHSVCCDHRFRVMQRSF